MTTTSDTNRPARPEPGANRPSGERRRRLAIPPQHGAWAYLTVPLVLGLALAGLTWIGVLFSVTWVLAYPASYYLGRALVVRWRRGSWSRIARRELRDSIPWIVLAAAGAAVLVATRPWLVLVGVVLALAWGLGMVLAHAGRERGFGNDLLLIAQSLVALPLLWWVTVDAAPTTAGPPSSIWWATCIVGVFFVGSVIHVKSLIREADDRRWHLADIGYHVAALALGVVSPWLLLPFGVALARAILLTPTASPRRSVRWRPWCPCSW